MASTNSLRKYLNNIRLCVINCEQPDEMHIYPLFDARSLPVGLVGPEAVPVRESSMYCLSLVSPVPLKEYPVQICVNGCEPIQATLQPWSLMDSVDNLPSGNWFSAEIEPVRTSNARSLFFLTYGFARVQIVLYSDDGEFCLSTKDLITIGNEPYQDELIEQMLNDLLNSSETTVIDWMLTYEKGREKRYSSIEAAIESGPNVSLLAYLQKVEEIVNFFKSHRDFFRYHGYTKIVGARRRLSFRSVRQITRAELSWISKNMDALAKTTAKTSISYCGDYYLPEYLESQKTEKTFDRYENRVLLGFIEEVIISTKKVRSELGVLWSDAKASLDSIEKILKSSGYSQDTSCASIQLIKTFCTREKRLFERLDGLINELENECRQYFGFFPNVVPFSEWPLRRTKVFQEIEAYSILFSLMERWHYVGDYALGRESFALQIYRLDELYEYYVLYRLLCWLHEKGYREDRTQASPISHIKFSSGSSNAGRCNIANFYNLRKGDTLIRLFYEPCISGAIEEEYGISLHRLSSPNSFSRRNRKSRPGKWTPDYLLEVRTDSDEKNYIFDAKFRTPMDVYSGFPDDSEFQRCLFKYKFDLGGTSPKDYVTSVWLLCGRYDDFYFKQMEQSPWAMQEEYAGSGIGVVTPFHSCLDEVFSRILPGDMNCGLQDDELSALSESNLSDVIHKSLSRDNATEAEIIAYVSDFYRVYFDRDKLFSAEWAQRKLGINHPLLRKLDPHGRESRYYRRVEIDGTNVYVYIGMMPQNKDRLVRLVRECRNAR